ncbi:hypothetical protein [Brevundimonas sp.]|jgi:hypothetical protein|uniref:hypothetical protein n=1 Tax=Brevundimonas sp. TaxID=1871086 RepID=UPI00378506EE
MIGFLFFTFAAVQSFWLHRLWVASDNHAARIATLEQSKPKAVVQAPQPTKPEKQSFEKPVIPGAKDVKPMFIGDGCLQFDEENQVAEWV